MTMDTILNRITWCLCRLALALLLCGAALGDTALFRSRQVTRAGEYTFGIEGPAVDSAGNLYVVNFQKAGTIGKLKPRAAASEFFAALPEGSIGNSIRFALDGRMFIADYKKHNIFVIEPGSAVPTEYFHSEEFNQPNDMTIASDGTIYASDPHWKRHGHPLTMIYTQSWRGCTIGLQRNLVWHCPALILGFDHRLDDT
jgi:hypothetical protein